MRLNAFFPSLDIGTDPIKICRKASFRRGRLCVRRRAIRLPRENQTLSVVWSSGCPTRPRLRLIAGHTPMWV
jgi:hypothetical protein